MKICPYIDAPCDLVGTQACREQSAIACRNRRQKIEMEKEEVCSNSSEKI
jgi:hypothetical protein